MASNMEQRGARRGNPWRIAIWGGATGLLLLPLVAMQFTREVQWTLSDFVVFGTMLLVACATYELATRLSGDRTYRAGVGVAVATAFLLVWVNLAVGYIGSEDNRYNLWFGGVLAVGILGSAVARLRPRGMARALVATAVAHGLVVVAALFADVGDTPMIPTAVFLALWLASAGLFRMAARNRGLDAH